MEHFPPPQTPRVPGPPDVTPVALAATPPQRTRRGILAAGMGAMTVAAVAAGAFVITRDSPDEMIVDDSTEVAIESEADATVAYSFAAAAESAQAASSVVFDMEIDSPDGPMSATASFDRASGRLAMDLDLSRLTTDDEMFDVADSISFIVDEQGDAAYVSSGLFGDMFGPADGWIVLTGDEFSMDDDAFGEVFRNPLNIADVFGDVEPIDLGNETIDGELLRHFEVTLDAEAIADLGEDTLMAPGVAVVDVTYDVWVDVSSQIRRIRFDVVSEGEKGSVDMWITISGDPIDIELPSPDEIVDLEEFFASTVEEFEVATEVTVDDEVTVDQRVTANDEVTADDE